LQLPVRRGFPPNVAVAVAVGPLHVAGSETTFPDIVESRGLAEVAEVDSVVAVFGGAVFGCDGAAVPLKGEQPTKSGAVSFTFWHSC
jgi:hypothetical protein